MERMDFKELDGNRETIAELLKHRHNLVPFIGAGFSYPACPTWGRFLDDFYLSVKNDFMEAADRERYATLKGSDDPDYEGMAALLVDSAERRRFAEYMEEQFKKPLHDSMKRKFRLLHQIFTGCKITTNFDCLIEENTMDFSSVTVRRGDEAGELEKLLTRRGQNSLLKIHGCLEDPASIVLSQSQYEKIYGHADTFDPEAPLPRFLMRVFRERSLLFIGCSLAADRTMTILEKQTDRSPHFALMVRPGEESALVPLNRRLSRLGIKPLWLNHYGEVEEVLELLNARKTQNQYVSSAVLGGISHPFVGREKELQQIETDLSLPGGAVEVISGRLFSIDGAGGVGKTTLAQEAAKRFGGRFPDGVVGPVRVSETTPMTFARDLGRRFGEPVDEPADEEAARQVVTRLLRERRVLLILDNVEKWERLRYMLPVQTTSAVIVTTRDRTITDRMRLEMGACGVDVSALREIRLETFSESEALAFFRAMLGSHFNDKHRQRYLDIAVNLGFLPIALRQAVSLMLFGPRYTVSRLLKKLQSEKRLEELRKGEEAAHWDDRVVETVFDMSSPLLTGELIEALQYLAVCAPGPVPGEFLERLSGDPDFGGRLERLFTLSWCERKTEETGEEGDERRLYYLHQLVRELVGRRFGSPFAGALLDLVHEIFTDNTVHFSVKDGLFPQLEEALIVAEERKDVRLKKWVYRLYDFCTYRGYLDFFLRLTESVERVFGEDQWVLRAVYSHRALILRRRGELDAALVLHRKEEAICKGLNDLARLSKSYGNQALIHQLREEWDTALALHKEEESICKDLDDRAGLSKSYGNQALILADRGEWDAAMALHKKEEAICEDLKDHAGLSRTYGNQASILADRGKFDAALALHKEGERIKKELGDRPGLAISWWNQGEIYEAKCDPQTQIRLWKQSIQLNKEMGIPTKEDEEELERVIKENGDNG